VTRGREMPAGEVLFEYRRIGNQVRVAALDPETGTEVVVVVPPNAPRRQIAQIAVAKLRRKLAANG